MKITKIETVCKSHLLMMRIHTEDGLIGCGEARIIAENGSFKLPQIPGIGAAWLTELFSQSESTYRASI